MTIPPDDHGPDKAQGVTRDLASRIASAKRERDRQANRASEEASTDMNGLARGMRMGTEFMAAVLVGAVVGYLIDLGLGTSPWGLLIMVLMGFAAGTMNVIRVVAEMNAASSVAPGAGAMGETRNNNDDA
ncbi:AtpZ/AtpI family protein [Devosia chinhatensis]|uniref:AtpZ/AtpI family protein n=1 Tax=Devosia chinhatensis TaxID=429727 RepID=UPI0006975CD5|nr:AtpZ/AtpI family protein [Devosia chinhatensis]